MEELTFEIPALIDRPMVGTSCCVTSAEAVITQEFWMLGGVDDSRVDLERGSVWVRYEPSQVSRETLSASLTDIGYPPVLAASGGQPR